VSTDSESEAEIRIKIEPVEENHVNQNSHDTELTNHIKAEPNGRVSPDILSNDIKPVVNNKHERTNHKKDGNIWTLNSSLRNLVVREIRKPGKRKCIFIYIIGGPYSEWVLILMMGLFTV